MYYLGNRGRRVKTSCRFKGSWTAQHSNSTAWHLLSPQACEGNVQLSRKGSKTLAWERKARGAGGTALTSGTLLRRGGEGRGLFVSKGSRLQPFPQQVLIKVRKNYQGGGCGIQRGPKVWIHSVCFRDFPRPGLGCRSRGPLFSPSSLGETGVSSPPQTRDAPRDAKAFLDLGVKLSPGILYAGQQRARTTRGRQAPRRARAGSCWRCREARQGAPSEK